MTADGSTTQRRTAASGSVLAVATGLAVYGGASFVFLAIAGRALGDSPGYTALALTWTLLNAVGIGLYMPVEQEGGRAIAGRIALALPARSALTRVLLYVGGSFVVVGALVALSASWLSARLFEHRGAFPGLLFAALVGMALAYLVRGVLAGTGRYPRYGVQLTLDGVLRLVGAGVVAWSGGGAEVFATVLIVSPVLASVAAAGRPWKQLDGGWRSEGPALGGMWHLVAAALVSQALANVGPVAVQMLRGPGDEASAGSLVNALTVARLPLFVFAAIQAVFLPRLAALAARDAGTEFRGTARGVAWGTAALAAVGVVGAWAVGRPAVRLLFGPTFDMTPAVITVLALSAGLFMIAQVAVQALLARRHDALALIGWSSGLAATLAALALPLPLAMRVAGALAIGSAVSAVCAGLLAVRDVRRWTSSERVS